MGENKLLARVCMRPYMLLQKWQRIGTKFACWTDQGNRLDHGDTKGVVVHVALAGCKHPMDVLLGLELRGERARTPCALICDRKVVTPGPVPVEGVAGGAEVSEQGLLGGENTLAIVGRARPDNSFGIMFNLNFFESGWGAATGGRHSISQESKAKHRDVDVAKLVDKFSKYSKITSI